MSDNIRKLLPPRFTRLFLMDRDVPTHIGSIFVGILGYTALIAHFTGLQWRVLIIAMTVFAGLSLVGMAIMAPVAMVRQHMIRRSALLQASIRRVQPFPVED